jgi:hypothetical protein
MDLSAQIGRDVEATREYFRGEAPRLGFYTPMEREAARATGLALITPDELEVGRLAREVPDPVEITAQILGRALELAGLLPGRIALAGRAPAGELVAAARKLESRGVAWVAGDEIARSFRKLKSAAQVAAVRTAAEGTCAAFRRVAELLAAAAARPAEGGELWLEGERLTVGRLRREVAARCSPSARSRAAGGEPDRPGRGGGVPHHTGTDERVLCAGRVAGRRPLPARLRCSPTARGPSASGAPPSRWPAAHALLVREALAAAPRDGARPGRAATVLQEGVVRADRAQAGIRRP